MKIGILGTGNMGRTLGVQWARAGHDVCFGARTRATAEAAAALAGPRARAGSLDDAAAFGDVVLYTLRGIAPSRVLRSPDALDGKIAIDCNNTEYAPSTRTGFAPPPSPSYPEQLARDAPGARVVQAFSTIPHVVLELAPAELARHRVAAFLCADDADAKRTVAQLAADLGLIAIDSGALADATIVAHAADFIRFHILKRGHGPHVALSLHPTGDASFDLLSESRG